MENEPLLRIMNHEFATKTSGLLDSTTFGYDVGGVPLGTFRPPYLEPVKTQFLFFFKTPVQQIMYTPNLWNV